MKAKQITTYHVKGEAKTWEKALAPEDESKSVKMIESNVINLYPDFAFQTIEGFGGAMGHSLGHSVGIDIHEAPNLSPRNPKALCAGNVVTVEPGIYLTGKFGMRLEDYGVVRDASYEVFTQSTHEMIIIS